MIAEILDYPGPFGSQEEQDECRRLVEELTVPEQEMLAQTSFAYWYRSMTQPQQECSALEDEARKRTAMKEARRHFVGEGRDFTKALESLRNSCRYREVRTHTKELSTRVHWSGFGN